MRTFRIVPLLLLTLGAAATADAQAPTPVLGISAGIQGMPDAFAPCGGTWGSIHAVAGLVRGLLSMEARLGHQDVLVITDCALAPIPDGIGRFQVPEVEEGTGTLAELRARVGIPSTPVHAGAGAGWLLGDGVPYALVQLGLHAPGRIRIGIDVEPTWYRIPVTTIEGEWRQGSLVRALSQEEGHEWQRVVSFRFGVGVALR